METVCRIEHAVVCPARPFLLEQPALWSRWLLNQKRRRRAQELAEAEAEALGEA
ncbi:hypothetical protein [Streptomyces sp. TLI_105]|uniref:hypothetical protein n=1 Tax=Streptomyces sp. TLI_105 TaxID=1881019 RepID=UPI0008947CC9|nr:hypothetical protein [Streptomyces sp. TLI_105]SEE60643.1 hypothetical protein SAMN05428939_8110 [Streptomyces sp. TLI_105]